MSLTRLQVNRKEEKTILEWQMIYLLMSESYLPAKQEQEVLP